MTTISKFTVLIISYYKPYNLPFTNMRAPDFNAKYDKFYWDVSPAF